MDASLLNLTASRKARVIDRFDTAASAYDDHSTLQRVVAQRLAHRIATLKLTPSRVLEIGCGTGHLTAELMPTLGKDWLVTDIAPTMVARCRQRFGDQARYAVMDGEHPPLSSEHFDLVTSSLAAQWFSHLPSAITTLCRLVAPGGGLALATLGAGTFAEWRDAHSAFDLAAATPDYPDAAMLARYFPADWQVTIEEETHVETFAEPLDFLRGLRHIGADTPSSSHSPLTLRQLRQVLRSFAASGSRASYHVLYVFATHSCSGKSACR